MEVPRPGPADVEPSTSVNRGGVLAAARLSGDMAAAIVSIAEFTPVFLADIEAIEAVAQADVIDEELWAALK